MSKNVHINILFSMAMTQIETTQILGHRLNNVWYSHMIEQELQPKANVKNMFLRLLLPREKQQP